VLPRSTLNWGLLLAVAGLVGCAVNPLTPTPIPSATPAPRVVVMVVITATPTPRAFSSPAPATPLPAEPTSEKFLAPEPSPTVAVFTGSGGPLPATEPIRFAPAPTQPVSFAPAPTPIPRVDVAPPPAADVAAAEQYCIDLINAERAAAGLPPMLRDESVMGVARARVADMVARGYRGHFDPVTGASLGRQMLSAAGFRLAGENWFGHRAGPVEIVDAAMAWFMTDPPHAQGILSTHFTLVGVGIAHNGAQWLLVQNFAGN
jgi:uncharacterized protein YkwD